jgi:RimJ/RimL family protein N-acetyltransferase
VQDPEIQRWIPAIPRPYTREDAVAFVSGEVDQSPHAFAVELEGELVAAIGLRIDQRENGEIGYWCAPEARGRGVVTRALRHVCQYAFDEVGIERLEMIIDPDNVASRRVAEKAGFVEEGVMRSHLLHPDGQRRDSVIYSLLPGDPA